MTGRADRPAARDHAAAIRSASAACDGTSPPLSRTSSTSPTSRSSRCETPVRWCSTRSSIRSGLRVSVPPEAGSTNRQCRSGALGASALKTAAVERRDAAGPSVFFDAKHSFEVGDTTFELLHTPGETPDHLTVWIPKLRAAFVGDNFYQSFPNLYTLRGTRPRWALEYVDSLNKVLALDPDTVLPSHGPAIQGRDAVRRELTKYRDAILMPTYHPAYLLRNPSAKRDVWEDMKRVRDILTGG